MRKNLVITFWTLLGVFIFVLSQFFIPAFRNLFRGSKLFLGPLIIFSLLGILLLVLTLKNKIERKLKKFLLLTGASATGFFVFVFLHNVFYALGKITGHILIINYLMEALHVVFFIIAIFICPIGFLVGIAGSIVKQGLYCLL